MKSGKYPLSVAAIALGLLVRFYAVSSAVEDYATRVRRDPDGCTVRVILQVGVDGTDADVTTVRNALTALTSIPWEISCTRPPHCKVTVAVDVKKWSDIATGDQAKYHKVTMVNDDDNPSRAGIGTPNGTSKSGTWRRERRADEYQHEALHFAGLGDKYCERVKNSLPRDWLHCPVPPGREPCGCVIAPKKTRCTEPCVGSENDLMATLGVPPTFLNILDVVARGGQLSCPEYPCCPPAGYKPVPRSIDLHQPISPTYHSKTILGWYEFNTTGGMPTTQGWTTRDATSQLKKYWHVDGDGGAGCKGKAPIRGTKSMWCGQWATTESPWCGWATLPGYGSNWDQSLSSTVFGTTLTYTIAWESEPGYDRTYVEWWDPANTQWVADANANNGTGVFDGAGGPLTESLTSAYGPMKARFHFKSDGGGSDEDGLWDSTEGAVVVDDISMDFGAVEDWEGEPCLATGSTDGKWVATFPPGFGDYSKLVSGGQIVQEDVCSSNKTYLWGFFDNPAVTNYACGGWPLQGAVPYGPNTDGLYLNNEIWSPAMPCAGTGSRYVLEFDVYRDLPVDNLVFYYWRVRSIQAGGCAGVWKTDDLVYRGVDGTWLHHSAEIGHLVDGNAVSIQVALGVVDMCGDWCGVYGSGGCHSHAPLFDNVEVVRESVFGPLFTSRDIDMWQDNFPELGGISPASYARCDMAQDILATDNPNSVPGDSLKIIVTDPAGLGTDNTGGRTGKAVYVFVKVTDRYGNPIAGKSGLSIQSPDIKAHPADATGLLRWPYVAGLAPAGWNAYRLDFVYMPDGGKVNNAYCGDLMDLAAGPDGPPYHALTENVAANTGIFSPGDVVNYFFGARNVTNQWSYYYRTFNGQGVHRRTGSISEAMASPMEWSVLPDAGRLPGDQGDILLVDDADDRGGPAQLYFDNAFKYMGLTSRVDRFDVLGPSSAAGNSLAGRVKNVAAQIIGGPVEIYQQVLWNSSDLSTGLMGDGGEPHGGSSAEKSDDYTLCYTFLNSHPDNPGWVAWGDDFVEDWSTLAGPSAVNVKSVFMNHIMISGDQKSVSGIVSPRVRPASPLPPAGWLQPTETFYANGGCPTIHDFDVPGQTGWSRVAHRYVNASTGPVAALSQATTNSLATTARFYLAGFAYDVIADDDTNGVPDYVKHLQEILAWLENVIGEPTGIPVAYENRLENAYPNPFNPMTTIKYNIAEGGQVTLKIYNAAGQLVRTVVDEEQAPREEGFVVVWDGKSDAGQRVASGVYFYRLTAKDFVQTKKLVVLK